MLCPFATVFFICVTSLQACPDPVTVHIQNYEGPIILHAENCDNQPIGNHGNPFKHCLNKCDTECSCISKLNYSPYNAYSGSYPATNLGCGCCPVDEQKPLVYCFLNGYDYTKCDSSAHSYNKCDSGKGHYQYKYPGY